VLRREKLGASNQVLLINLGSCRHYSLAPHCWTSSASSIRDRFPRRPIITATMFHVKHSLTSRSRPK